MLRIAVLALSALLGIASVACETGATPTPGGVGATCAAPYPAGPPTAESVFCADPSALERATTVKIIDGDTLDVIVDGTEERVRLFGVDTPERGDECFREATDRLRTLAGDVVLLRRDARNRDSNRRLLRYVFAPGGVSIDALLVAEGLAVAWTRDGIARDALVALEERARNDGVGCLWRMTSLGIAGTIRAGAMEV